MSPARPLLLALAALPLGAVPVAAEDVDLQGRVGEVRQCGTDREGPRPWMEAVRC